ncbi:hypothetical protein ACJ41O_010106 [Fusarium nematophilum]
MEKNIEKVPSPAYDAEDLKDGEAIDNRDAALQFLNTAHVTTMTAEDEKLLVRKIDIMIVPLMFGCYFLQYVDKTLINYANVMGLQEDTGISGDQYSQLALVFYISYLAFEFPTGYLMQRLPTAKYLGTQVCGWGLMVACTAAANNWAGLVSLRVLLGCFEAVVAPALMLLTTMWYKKSEQPPRVGLWYIGTGTGKMVGALTSFGFQHYTGAAFKSWQIMFLVFGLVTIVVGVLVFLLMPDNPMTAARLSEQEKAWAIERLRGNLTGVENKRIKAYQIRECFVDPQTWLLILIVLASNIPNGFISSYQATVIKSFGFTSKQTALLSIPSGAIACVATMLGTWFAGRWNLRGPFIIGCLGMGFIGSSLMAFLPEDGYTGPKMLGNYCSNFIGSSLPLMYSYAGANYAGHTKKVTMNAIVLISFCIGNIIGPLTFRAQDAPAYIPAKVTMVVATAFSASLTGLLMVYYRWENKRRDVKFAGEAHRENSEFFDLTDRENHEFRVSRRLATGSGRLDEASTDEILPGRLPWTSYARAESMSTASENLGSLDNGAPRRKRYASRSRAGCLTCRRRRKRCIGQRPRCDACQRLDLGCVWEPKRLAREDVPETGDGRLDGRRGTTTTGGDDDKERNISRPRRRRESTSPTLMSSALALPPSIDLDPPDADQRMLMSYYIHCYVPSISVVNSPTNFFTSVYIPMAFSCNGVRSAILASASTHLFKKTPDPCRRDHLLRLSLHYRAKCHLFLKHRISPSGSIERDVLESMASIMVLVGLEVQNGNNSPTWIQQLDCVRAAIRQHGGRRAFCSISWEAQCVFHHFLYHDVMGWIMAGVARLRDGIEEDPEDDCPDLTASSLSTEHGRDVPRPPPEAPQQPEFPWAACLYEDAGGGSTSASGSEPGHDTFHFHSVHPLLGLCRGLFLLIQKIRHVKFKGAQTNTLTDAAPDPLFSDLERQIATLEFHGASQANRQWMALEASSRLDLLALAETYRTAALILLYRRSVAHAHLRASLTLRILELVERIPPGSKAEAGLTHPLFLAGAELVSEADMLRCAVRLAAIRERFKALSNIHAVETVLRTVWRERLNGGRQWDWECLLKRWNWVLHLG